MEMYVCMGPMTDKNVLYGDETLGFDWLKNHRGVILFMYEQK